MKITVEYEDDKDSIEETTTTKIEKEKISTSQPFDIQSLGSVLMQIILHLEIDYPGGRRELFREMDKSLRVLREEPSPHDYLDRKAKDIVFIQATY